MKYFENRFLGKVIIITGAARGIGAATARRAAKEGAKVVLVDKRANQGEKVLKEIRDAGGDAIFLPFDISIEENAAKMIEETVKTLSLIHI